MTGMKEGAGEDPFAEEPSTASSTGVESPEEEEKEEEQEKNTRSAADSAAGASGTDDPDPRGSASQRQSVQIPYKFRRDGVQDGRGRVPLFLQEETKNAERDALRELEERFEANVSLTDLREALVKVGLDNLDDVERHLEEWGYGMTFDE